MTVASTDFTPKIVAGVELLRRCGMESFQLRYSDDERPIVWIAVAILHERITGRTGVSEAAAALHPETATMRLCAQLVDGGTCSHCGKPTGFEVTPDAMPLQRTICWYQWDPELKTFRRGCEGES